MASLSGILSSTRLDSEMHGAGETCYQDLSTILEPGLEDLLAFPLGASTDQRGMVNFHGVHRYADKQVQLGVDGTREFLQLQASMIFHRDSLFYDSPLNGQGIQQGMGRSKTKTNRLAGSLLLVLVLCPFFPLKSRFYDVHFPERLGSTGFSGISTSRSWHGDTCVLEKHGKTLGQPVLSGCREPGTCHKPVEQLQTEDVAISLLNLNWQVPES